MKLDSLEMLFKDELADLYDAENQLIKTLPKLADAAHAPELKHAFKDHLRETQNHAQRIEQIWESLGDGSVKSQSCKGMQGLIKEGGERLKARGDASVIDAGIIGAAQRVEHYEIAGYGCARTYAELLGMSEAARLLEETISEEKAADKKLNELALTLVNQEAARA